MKKEESDIEDGERKGIISSIWLKKQFNLRIEKKLTKNINNWTEDINENQLSKNLVLVLGYANSNKKNDEAIPFCCFYYYLYFNLLHVYLFDTRVVMVIFLHFLSVLWLI